MGQDVRIQFKNASGSAQNVDSTHPLPVDIGGGLVGLDVNQKNPNTDLTKAWPIKLTDGTDTADITATGAVKTDGSATTQPVSAASLPLPSGASTSALQGTGNTSLASIDTKTPALVTGRVPVDGSGVTQPVSGSVSVSNFPATQAVSASSLPLPTGAATSALQGTANTSLASIDTKTPALGQALAAASVPVVLTASQITTLTPPTTVATTQSGTWTVQPGNTANTTPWLVTSRTQDGAGNSVTSNLVGTLRGLDVSQMSRTVQTLVRNDYSSTSVTTSAYTQLVASTTAVVRELEIFDSSGQTLVIATGAAASEVNLFYVFPGGNGRIPVYIAGGTRISIKAVSANATSGEFIMNVYS
jgi:hypothetical protein